MQKRVCAAVGRAPPGAPGPTLAWGAEAGEEGTRLTLRLARRAERKQSPRLGFGRGSTSAVTPASGQLGAARALPATGESATSAHHPENILPVGHQCFLRGCGLPWGREGAGVTRLSRRLYFLQSVTSAGGACARARAAKPGIRDQGRPASAASARLQGRSVELWSQQGGSVSCRRAKEHELRILHKCWHAGHSMALPAGGFISHPRRPRIGATGSWGRHIKFSPDQLQTTGRGLRAENSGMQADFLEPALPGTASPCGGESGLFRCPPQLGSDSSPIPATGSAAPFTCHRVGGRQAHCASPGFLMCALQKSSEPGAHHLLCIGAPWASGQMGEAPALTQGPPGSLPTAPSRRAPSPSASCQVPAGSQRAHGPLAGPGPLVSWGSHPGERPTLCSFCVLHTLQPVLLPEAWVLVASPPLRTWGGRCGMSQGCNTLARFSSRISGDGNPWPRRYTSRPSPE